LLSAAVSCGLGRGRRLARFLYDADAILFVTNV
jgi:hypothetical protein